MALTALIGHAASSQDNDGVYPFAWLQESTGEVELVPCDDKHAPQLLTPLQSLEVICRYVGRIRHGQCAGCVLPLPASASGHEWRLASPPRRFGTPFPPARGYAVFSWFASEIGRGLGVRPVVISRSGARAGSGVGGPARPRAPTPHPARPMLDTAEPTAELLVRSVSIRSANGRRSGSRKTINLHIHKRVDPIAKTAITRRCAVQGWSQVFEPGWTPKKIKKSRLCACAGSLKHKDHWSPENQDCGKKNQEIGKIPSSSFNVKMICYIGER